MRSFWITACLMTMLMSSALGRPWGPMPKFRGASAEPLLKTLDTADRAKGAFLLGQIGDRKAVPALAKLLNDQDRTVRIHTGIAVASLGDERGIPTCASVLKSEPAWIRCYAAYALWQTNTPRARQVLKQSLAGQDKFISSVINGALMTPYAPPASKSSVKPETWADAGDALTEEADWWWHEGDFEQAVRCLQAILFLEPDDVQSYGLAAWLQWSMGRDEQAVNTLKRGIAAVPDSSEMYFEMASHYMKTERYLLAREPLEKALDLGGDDMIRRQYAHCLEKLGRYSASLEQWAILLEKSPNDPVVKMNYERVKAEVNSKQ